ncbi:protein PHYLLO, chloroplastic isoform X2 [Magnolia sinica]|uniref:protein PHYLLO, chloroplastic isoform X2 n=1 Tax=Magnolia sinica TaxID=86752 RepID=UPI00265840B3|nr:protein PHYLLO, chloroplastic isoform X2 [Magnolia sinica]
MKVGSNLLHNPPPAISAVRQLPTFIRPSSFCTARSFPTSGHLHRLRSRSNPNFKILGANGRAGMECSTDTLPGMEDSDLPVELCQTYTLPPALTLEDAANQIKQEIEKLKLKPPHSSSGVLRFQVPVPASVKALDWLRCQPQSLEAFPQFYLSGNQCEKTPYESVSLEEKHGVSGIGSVLHFTGSSYTLKGRDSIKRYLSASSPLIRAYGFIGINYSSESSSMKHETDSFYFFIPQIELEEFETNSLLAATLVWDDSFRTFKKAVHSFELSFHQAIYHVWPTREYCHDKWISYVQEKSDLEVQTAQMVCLNAHSSGKDIGASHLQLEGSPISFPFYFRLSATTAFTNNKPQLDGSGSPGLSYLLHKCANINAVWAALIIEECTRLGLTYFCIAPGSRSSPLAVAASTHPLTTCISCYDERSLAFHAVGYARGSQRPAVVITSSGTAVSNLLPAVVEASQDFVPLLLLTADRPPEMLDTGANQTINQVNHFGSFVRYFFSLPPPSDNIPARMVLTTVDSAVYRATQTPSGPAHINCSFREPLEDSPREWTSSCLKGLDLWMSKIEPFTKYTRLEHFYASNDVHEQVAEALEMIQHANRGLLVLGAIHTDDEIWAAVLLARHLFWPVVADILSGLRLRKVLNLFPEIEKNFLFVDHLDHAMLSESVRSWTKPDVIVQLGSRITSKRITQILERCSPCSYIMVDKHPYRHDPSHILTHRLQSTISEFAAYLLKVNFPRNNSRWHTFLQALDMMVAREISFQIHSDGSLTEPHVAQVISEALSCDAALFIGNSMAIRDADMYGRGWVNSTTDISSTMSNWGLPFCGIRVAGNRGASGIDGLLSTAVGFAVGSNKRVLCVIGDVSFLHDTNGLAILRQRMRRKPMTIVVTNNHGGAIFSLLPIAERTDSSILQKYFYTSHDVSIGKLCEAHSVKHLHVRTKEELQHALWTSQHSQTDYIIEVESSIEKNATFHSLLTKSARQAADHALSTLSALSISDHVSSGSFLCKIHRMEFSSYRIQLCAPLTSTPRNSGCDSFYRDGFILTLSLEDGSVGFGEIAPIEIHKEDLVDVEEQLRFLIHTIKGAEISYQLPLLKGSFTSWIWRSLGIQPSSIFPSVRCGLEMAILNALAARQGTSLLGVILGSASSSLVTQSIEEDEMIKRSSRVQICALVDSSGTPEEVAHVVAQLVDEGFTTIKLKVARRANPVEDAAVVHEIRQKVGHLIKLRVDANRNWTFEEAVLFGSRVKCYDLQYIEEPVHSEDDIIKFCEETGLPVALDETIDHIQGDPLNKLMAFVHPGIVAVVIKPSVVGGFENAAVIAKWAQQHEKMAVISAAYESSLSLASYVQFACYLEQQNMEICKMKNKELRPTIAHGLGTYRWLKEDVTTEPLKIGVHPHGDTVEAFAKDAALFLQNFQINHDIVQKSYSKEQVWTYQWTVDCEDFSCSLQVRDVGRNSITDKTVIFLHGFLGTGEDWVPIMKSLSANTRCISIDLPGHGKSHIQRHADIEAKQELISIELVADMLSKLIHDINPGKVVLVGYSLGARIALYMALRCNEKIDGAVIISGSPGLKDEAQRNMRAAQDDSRAHHLITHGLLCFLDTWYRGELWNRSLWDDLKKFKKPFLFIFGENDRKFKEIAQQMCSEICLESETEGNQDERTYEMIQIPDCGHAVHLENPLPMINAIRKFLYKLA